MDIEEELEQFLDHELEYVDRATHVILASDDGIDWEPYYVMPGQCPSEMANRILGGCPCVYVYDLKTKEEFTEY